MLLDWGGTGLWKHSHRRHPKSFPQPATSPYHRQGARLRRLLIPGYGSSWIKPSIYGKKPGHSLTAKLLADDLDEETKELLGVSGLDVTQGSGCQREGGNVPGTEHAKVAPVQREAVADV